MIVIPMMGRSSRFLDAGYLKPKYQLTINHQTMFELAVNSFSPYFSTEHFLFIVRNDHDNRRFVSEEVSKLGIKDFRILEIDGETRGQADSVYRGTKLYSDQTQVIIFNIDTIRHGFSCPNSREMEDGFLEVFIADGDSWSFIEPGKNNSVIKTAEKKRISNLCSDGLYIFKELGDFRAAFESSVAENIFLNGETYIAPLYNFLIKNGKSIKYKIIQPFEIDVCGTPVEYEIYKKKHEHL